MNITYKLLIIFSLCGVTTASLATDYYPERTHLIDQNTQLGTYLFRGNMPLIGKGNQRTFQYEQLSKQLKKYVKILNSGFYLIDVSLINKVNSDERKDLNIENVYFDNNPDKGVLAHHAIFGQLVSYPRTLKKLFHQSSNATLATIKLPIFLDKLPSLIEQLGQCTHKKQCDNLAPLYNNPDNLPVVIYFHCESGTDRTGNIAASYRMHYKNMGLNQAWNMNLNESYRSPNKAAQRETENYCARITPYSDWVSHCIIQPFDTNQLAL
ncbi:dual specificity protein phosphatase family protein [Shewanella sp. 202IG2-18]|uniref:dual specificity protein phosphatase family protein n=1 Tax=Parashewanella hymeniacidonis TaxID=2807618 RepID=UPI001961D866|nr:dual specificity protein phosphatase family protein [Parashewanella hymeniacidonis]MBM7070486.1 dual specificity protein phosphatase family protein [Parashewanella hymeniacidonis]